MQTAWLRKNWIISETDPVCGSLVDLGQLLEHVHGQSIDKFVGDEPPEMPQRSLQA
jgi:hypothetical protein